MTKKEQKKIKKLKEELRMSHEEIDMLHKENEDYKKQISSYNNLKSQKMIEEKKYKKIYLPIILTITLILYIIIEQYVIPLIINFTINDNTIGIYLEKISLVEEKNDLLDFINKNNTEKYSVANIENGDNGEMVFSIEENEDYQANIIKIPKIKEFLISYMVNKFCEMLVFDIITLTTIVLTLLKKFTPFINYSKKIQIPFLILIIIVISIFVTFFLLWKYQINWKLGNLWLNYFIKYMCIIFCFACLIKDIFVNASI